MKKILLLSVCVLSYMAVYSCEKHPDISHKTQPEIRKSVEQALVTSIEHSKRLYKSVKDVEGALPRTEKDGKLVTSQSKWWTSGFFPGTLWYLYEYSADPELKTAAEMMTQRVEKEQFTTDNHDVGFIINCSFGNGYRLTDNKEYIPVLINAAKSLGTRFNPTVGCTRSWKHSKWKYPVIIDNMMNLELLCVASSLSGDKTYYEMALSHADKSLINHFRPDGSSYHVVDYDVLTGKVLSQATHQGASDASSWARGQGWGLYGYTMMYRMTGKQEYLDHAIKIGKYIMNHPRLPEDKIPYWDFDAPNIPNADRDASAGAVMAAAFIELSNYTKGKLATEFFRLGEQQIVSLASEDYIAKIGENSNFILRRSTGYMARNIEVNAPLTYADYYFVEAMVRYLRVCDGKPVIDVKTISKNK